MTDAIERAMKIEELQKIRKYTSFLFILFFIIPLFLSPAIILHFEHEHNQKLNNYLDAFSYTYETMIGADLTDMSAVTDFGKITIAILSLFYLIFFGFVVVIITTTIEIRVLYSIK